MEQLLAYATLAVHVVIAVFLILLLARSLAKKKFFDSVFHKVSKYAVSAAFIVALLSMVASLYYSEFLRFAPCILCWYQRMFMYSLVVILGVALWNERRDVHIYALPLAILGGIIAAYHVLLEWAPTATPKLVDCTLGGVDCTVTYVQYFGYISIPVMSLTAFVLIGISLYLSRKS